MDVKLSRRINNIAFILLGLIVLALVISKAIQIPMTHDEIPTALHYSKYSYWEIMMYPDNVPNNHILNTVLAKFCISIFGVHQWSVRIPSMIGFIIYLIAAYRILSSTVGRTSLFFIPGALLFVSNLYLLDFFSLSRGYGLSAAFCLLATSYVISAFKAQNNKHILFAVFAATLASYANFTLLYFWAATMLMSVIYVFWSSKTWKDSILRLLMLGFYAVLYVALILTPIIKMQSTDQFIYWTSNGFYNETIIPLVNHSLYGSRAFTFIQKIGVGIVAVFSFALFYQIGLIFNRRFSIRKPIVTLVYLILATVLLNVLHQQLTNTPNLNGRTAVFFAPLFIALLIVIVAEFREMVPKMIKIVVFVGVVVVCLSHFRNVYKTESVREWDYDQGTFEVLNYIDQRKETEKPLLEMSWFFFPSFSFYYETEELPVEINYYHKEIIPETEAVYYYVPVEDTIQLMDNFKVDTLIFRNALMKRRN